MSKRNSTALKQRLSGRWLRALCDLAPSLRLAAERVGQNVPCPVDGSEEGFRLLRDANETGGGCKQSFRVFPEGIELLMWLNDWSFTKTFDELEAWLGDKPVDVGRSNTSLLVQKPVDETWLKNWLNRIWNEALPITHTKAYPARAYFYSRRIFQAATAASDIRFHPNLKYKDQNNNLVGTYGAVLLKVRNNEGKPVSIHRTYITKCGRKVDLGKLNKPKKMTPSLHQRSKGRHCRLFAPQHGCLGLSEGLETALAVYQAKQFPVWPGISTSMVQGFVPPKGVHTVINFVDKDRSKAGENTHEILKANLSGKGIRVIDLLPPTPILDSDEKGVDWADQLIRDVSGFDLLDEALSLDYLQQA